MDINFPRIMKNLKEKITISPHDDGLLIKTREFRKLSPAETNYLYQLPMFSAMRDIIPVEYWHLDFAICRLDDNLLVKTPHPELAREFIENMMDPKFIKQLLARLARCF